MRAFFSFYQIFSPLVLFPLSLYLWISVFKYNYQTVILVFSIPLLFSYIVAGLGTNYFKLWEFHTKFKLGNYTPLHGFMFAGGTTLLALFSINQNHISVFNFFKFMQTGFITACTVGFVNWLFDIYAMKSGYASAYNRKNYKELSAEQIALDYAPVYFGSFGLCYGFSIYIANLFPLNEIKIFFILLIALNMICMIIPVLLYIGYTVIKFGETGTRSYKNN